MGSFFKLALPGQCYLSSPCRPASGLFLALVNLIFSMSVILTGNSDPACCGYGSACAWNLYPSRFFQTCQQWHEIISDAKISLMRVGTTNGTRQDFKKIRENRLPAAVRGSIPSPITLPVAAPLPVPLPAEETCSHMKDNIAGPCSKTNTHLMEILTLIATCSTSYLREPHELYCQPQVVFSISP